ncbi:MAG TPA: DUF2510 domain-containing protein, partial [Acidimicrobiales bacterium]|nr:DUF2510 domain-containing protein [Acidimicrobiales bacterium]
FSLWHVHDGWKWLSIAVVALGALGVLGGAFGRPERVNNNGLLVGMLALIPLIIGALHYHAFQQVGTEAGFTANTTFTITVIPIIGTYLAFGACAVLVAWPLAWSATGGRRRAPSTGAPARPVVDVGPSTFASAGWVAGASTGIPAHETTSRPVTIATGSAPFSPPAPHTGGVVAPPGQGAPNIGSLPTIDAVLGSTPDPAGAAEPVDTGWGASVGATLVVAPSVVAGWYVDPSDPGQLRWWDGDGWTTHVHAAPA